MSIRTDSSQSDGAWFFKVLETGPSDEPPPKQENGADDDEQLDDLVAGEHAPHGALPAWPKMMLALKSEWTTWAMVGPCEVTPRLGPKLLVAEPK